MAKNKKNRTLNRGILVFVIAVVGSALAWVALAAPRRTTADLIITPNPAKVNPGNITLIGCGYYPNTGVSITVSGPTAYSAVGGPADAKGCLNLQRTTEFASTAGNYTFTAKQYTGKGNYQEKTMAQTTWVVQ